MTRDEGQAQAGAEAERALTELADVLALALGAGGTDSGDLRQLADRLGLTGPDRSVDEATLRALVAPIEAIGKAMAAGEPDAIDAAGKKIETLGVELGGPFHEAVRLLREQRRFHDARVGPQQIAGRRIDDLVVRLERQIALYAESTQGGPGTRQDAYARAARSAIADSLREIGITPLNDPGAESS